MIEDAESRLASSVDALAAEHRRELVDALRALPVTTAPREAEGVIRPIADEYARRYDESIRETVDGVLANASTQAAQERQRQQERGGTPGTGVSGDALRDVEQRQRAVMGMQSWTAAQEISSRVTGEVRSAWASGGLDTFATQQTAEGLARAARPAMNKAISYARVQEATEQGAVVVGAIRTAIRDASLCDHCAGYDRTEWRFPEDLEDFPGERGTVPDPSCEGAPKCRCTLLLVWG